ncbi:MAG: matrixin family metalloprotease [Deltaproteobacteria bacterium]|nr:matrixin family metalloprotease [Deltaproteobacteria bacterium]
MRRARGLALAVALALAGLAAAGPPARAWVPFRTESGLSLHWLQNPLRYRIAADVPAELAADRVTAIAAAAFAAWADLACHPLPAVSDGYIEGAVFGGGDRKNTIVWVTDVADWNARHSATELARTTLYFRATGEIVDADIEVNVGGFDFSDDAGCTPGLYDLQATLTHEVGHFIGLDHSPVIGACMAERADAGDCGKRELAEDDREGFCAIYEPVVQPVDPGPEPVAEPVADGVLADTGGADGGADAASHVDGADDGGCSAARPASPALPAALLLALAWLAVSRRGPSATARDRRARRPARAR